MRFGLAVFLVAIYAGSVSAQAPNQQSSDDFASLDDTRWCDCRMQRSAFSSGKDADQTAFGRIAVIVSDVMGDDCTSDEKKACASRKASSSAPLASSELLYGVDAGDDLGPSLIVRPQASSAIGDIVQQSLIGKDAGDGNLPGGPYCTPQMRSAAVPEGREKDAHCVQRVELTWQGTSKHQISPKREAYHYTIRFRVPGKVIDVEKSVRWVIAQWKQDAVDGEHYKDVSGPSWDGPGPFLAQRYDNGVLHVTAQAEDCRCLIAWQPHKDGPAVLVGESRPVLCERTSPLLAKEGRPAIAEKSDCTADTPLRVTYFESGLLEDPQRGWTTMRYRVEAGGADSRIVVWQNDRKIVEVKGPIGHKLPPPDPAGYAIPVHVYFKLGHYRDFMPFTDFIDIDRVMVEPSRS